MIKTIGRELGWRILVCSSLLIKYMPSGIIKALQKIISGTASLLLRSRNNVALNNLNYVYAKEKNKKEIRHILKSFMRNIIEYYCELIKQDNKAYKDIKELVHLEGRENLDKALGKGRGVIAVSAHLGNFPIVCARLTSEGYAYSAIIGNARDERVKKYFSSIWENQGMEVIPSLPVFTALKGTMEALSKNRIVAIYADQNRARGGIFVDFFGRKAATVTSPATIAIKMKVPVIPMFIVRIAGNKHKIVIEPELEIKFTGNEQEDISMITEKINRIIERYIKLYPEEWWWFHDRWKTKPKNTGESS